MITTSRVSSWLNHGLTAHHPRLAAIRLSPRLDLQEFSGGLGDIGVMVPIMATLIVQNGFNATSLLLVFGLTYVATGVYYRVPVPVQPLKAMAAIAIAQGLGADAVCAGAIVIGILLLALAATGLIKPLTTLFSHGVIRGIQLAVGLLLLRAALKLSLSDSIVRDGGDAAFQLGSTTVPVALVIAAALLPVMLIAATRRTVPVMLALLPPSIVAGALISFPGVSGSDIGPQTPDVGVPSLGMMLSADPPGHPPTAFDPWQRRDSLGGHGARLLRRKGEAGHSPRAADVNGARQSLRGLPSVGCRYATAPAASLRTAPSGRGRAYRRSRSGRSCWYWVWASPAA